MKLHVGDLMSKKIKSLAPDMSAAEALKFIVKHDISGLPVIDKHGNLVGMFTEKEVLASILPGYIKDVGEFVYAQDPKSEVRKMASLAKLKVKDLMRTEVVTVNGDTSLSEVSKIMLMKAARRIVVMGGGKPVGIIARCDVVRALAKEAKIL